MKKNKTYFSFLILLLFCCIRPVFPQTKIIAEGDVWHYYDKKEAPPKGWENSSEIIRTWESGVSGLGYGDSSVTTEIDYGGDPKNKYLTAYFSKEFTIDDPFEYIIYELRLEKDDGAVVYLNGREIMRADMPFGKIDHYTRATGLIVIGKMEARKHTITLLPEDLIAGKNIISVSVHQGKKTSGDLIFNMELIGNKSSEKLPLLLKERTIKNLNLDLKLTKYAHKQELEKKDLEYKLLEQSKESFGIYLYVVLALLFVTVYLWFNTTNRQKKLVADIESLKELNKNKDSEMMHISLNSLNNKQFLKEVKKDLEETVKNTSGNGKTLDDVRRVIKSIEYNIDSGEDWENLKKHFNVVHSGYVDKLSELHPSLTEVELRHCIFIKLHMQTKEIANVLHIDPRSVQASRYRLKKKMNLGESTNLKEYLLSI